MHLSNGPRRKRLAAASLNGVDHVEQAQVEDRVHVPSVLDSNHSHGVRVTARSGGLAGIQPDRSALLVATTSPTLVPGGETLEKPFTLL
jgi:hypothetical protein